MEEKLNEIDKIKLMGKENKVRTAKDNKKEKENNLKKKNVRKDK